jgi:hypothetical protein
MGQTPSKRETKRQKRLGVAEKQAASPRLNVALSALSVLRFLPVFFGRTVHSVQTGKDDSRRTEGKGNASGSETAAQRVKVSATRNTGVLRRAGFGHE